MPGWDLIYYTTSRGDCPVQTYIDELPAQKAVRVYEALELLAEFGVRLGMPHMRALQDSDLWELRVRTRGNQHRVFYKAIDGRRMLLLHAFQKKGPEHPTARDPHCRAAAPRLL